MAKNWTDMVNEAKAEVMEVLPEEALRTLRAYQDALLIEVRDADSGKVPGCGDDLLGYTAYAG